MGIIYIGITSDSPDAADAADISGSTIATSSGLKVAHLKPAIVKQHPPVPQTLRAWLALPKHPVQISETVSDIEDTENC